jgi:cytochrome oxidase Cu insertion factor (SCO1/SenC/PrrC family)
MTAITLRSPWLSVLLLSSTYANRSTTKDRPVVELAGLESLDGRDVCIDMLELVSIGFDPDNDGRQALKLYGDRYGATAPRWRIAMPSERRDRAGLLQTFGVVVIPDGMGGFVHNNAMYLVDPSGHLVRIIDPEAPARLVATALDVSKQ